MGGRLAGHPDRPTDVGRVNMGAAVKVGKEDNAQTAQGGGGVREANFHLLPGQPGGLQEQSPGGSCRARGGGRHQTSTGQPEKPPPLHLPLLPTPYSPLPTKNPAVPCAAKF